jgi:hypothetical protein
MTLTLFPAPFTTLLVIPVFNHAGTLRVVAEGCLKTGLPVLIVDDGSLDQGLAEVAGLAVRTHRLPVNRGKGGAILEAAALARDWGYDAILTLDADGQHDPADAAALLAAAEPRWPCIAVGARRMEGPDVPASSLFGRAFSNFWVRLECGQTMADTQSGFRLYPVAYLLATRFLTRRYSFEVEVLVRAVWGGLPVLTTPISVHYPPGDERITHFRAFRDNLRLTCLHTWLVTRSLLPWPHTKAPGAPPRPSIPSLWHPRAFLRHCSREYTSPRDLAMAVWLGVFLGSLPIIPFGLAAIVYASHRFRLNKLAAVAASNLCVAPFLPFLCIQGGHLLLTGHLWTDFSRQALLHQVHFRLFDWLIGALLIGPILALLPAFLVFRLAKSFQA